ncbi:hypothetical protein J1N35_025070 [Gossypium stocksii]|uniref:Reverse transcriptase domain-containing protein n=1 Tax=Gossypium stocksii TaxID=47602 RepID=A0A9D3V5V9_9ROSI|nr:hypothetical protein J1N35_025070 [Gossypium stocksii]
MAVANHLQKVLKRMMGQKGSLTLKLDMSKAYDRVEWVFLDQMTLKIGFASSCVDFIMHCISSAFYSICLNKKIGERFKPKWGLRQGEGLSSLTRLAIQGGLINGVRLKCIGVKEGTDVFYPQCQNF